jgi:hypothetical protein
MSKTIFAFMQAYGGNERESLLLAHSLRKFGGEIADSPLWLMMPQDREQVSESTRQTLEELGVQVHRFGIPEEALEFPFGSKVYAAAAAESLASNGTDILVWMDSDTLFAGEPTEFLLDEKVSLGYRPVMLKNISSLYDEPLNSFWNSIYDSCGTQVDEIPPMTTTVDEVRIRPQFNAGIMSLRPQMRVLNTWQDNFEQIYLQPKLALFYEEHSLYRIFVHQSILSATILAMLKPDEMQDLGPRINCPMFLEVKGKIARKAVTLRYDEYKFFEQPDWEEKVILSEFLRKWLQTRLFTKR